MIRRTDDTLPYDRERIRSGGTRARRGRRSSQERQPSRGHARRPRRRGSFARTLRRVVVLALLVMVIAVVLLFIRAAAFNATVSSAVFPSSALLWDLNGSDRVNVLLVGYGGTGHGGGYLADSIQVISVDPRTDTTTTIPIPRDLWIEGIGSFGQGGKVNEVFAAGYASGDLDQAGDLLARVLSEVTGLRIEHWLSIDFAGFSAMVDAVGGVTIENPVAFSYTMNQQLHDAGNWDRGTFPAGEIQLDGAEALAYTRARYTSVVAESTDFARSVRQSRVLSALRAKVGGGGIGSILPGLSLMDAMEDRVRTDVSAIDLFLLSSHLSSDDRVELTEGVVLTATSNSIGQYILVPTGWTGPGDYGGLRAYLESRLAQAPPTGTDAP